MKNKEEVLSTLKLASAYLDANIDKEDPMNRDIHCYVRSKLRNACSLVETE